MDDDEDEKVKKKEEVPPEPVEVLPPFEGIYPLVERLLMLSKFAPTWQDRHDAALAFLEQSATILADLGNKSSATLWTFIEGYERPRVRVWMPPGGLMAKLEELGVKITGGQMEVPIAQSQTWYDKVLERTYADSYFEKLAKVVSETTMLLVKVGVLRRHGVMADPFAGLKEADDGSADSADED